MMTRRERMMMRGERREERGLEALWLPRSGSHFRAGPISRLFFATSREARDVPHFGHGEDTRLKISAVS